MDTARQTLRRQLAKRQREKAELEQRVRGLEARYRQKVAPLKEKVLRLRVQRLREAAQAHVRSARLRNAYHDAQRAYDAFQEARAESSASERSAQAAFRRASTHCHPDRVPDDYRAEAEATFQALEGARQSGYTDAVHAIAQALDQWGFPSRTSGPAARGPQALGEAIAELEASIQQLRGTDAYQVLQETDDPEGVIESWMEDLRHRVRRLVHAGPSRAGPIRK